MPFSPKIGIKLRQHPPLPFVERLVGTLVNAQKDLASLRGLDGGLCAIRARSGSLYGLPFRAELVDPYMIFSFIVVESSWRAENNQQTVRISH